MAQLLNVAEVNVSYGDLQALWNVSLHLEAGEIVSIVGPNSAGKSTLLATISGLLRAHSGSIEFLGQRIDRLFPHNIVELGLIHVPEERHLFPEMPVMENWELGTYCHRAKEAKDENFKWVFELFPILEARRKQLAGSLSGGEQQMLAIGRALMLRPVLLMLDEPSLGLAPKVVTHLFDTVKRIHREGITVLLVEQNVQRSLALSHRAYVLETGRMTLEGSGDQLLEDEQVKKAYLGM